MRLRITFLIIFFTAFVPACSPANESITTFILIRHAEKAADGTDDPDLKPEGVERAAKLVQMFSDTPLSAIYSTKFKRTQQTVAPLAKAKARSVQEYEAFKVEEIERMLSEHAGGTILICGHSNNIPWIANTLIGKEQYPEYQDTEYGIMLVVSVVKKGKLATSLRVKY